MIISNSKKFIFVHIHKTGGTTIVHALDNYLKWNDLILGGTSYGESIQSAYQERFHLNKHSTADEIRGVIGPEIWGSFFKFAFVRHPYTRMVSLYNFAKKNFNRLVDKKIPSTAPAWNWPEIKIMAQTTSFSEFIRSLYKANPAAMKRQIDWISDDKGKIIVDFVGKLENINEDFKVISDKIKIDSFQLVKKNVSGNNQKVIHNLFLHEEDYEFLNMIYRRDFEILGYDANLRI